MEKIPQDLDNRDDNKPKRISRRGFLSSLAKTTLLTETFLTSSSTRKTKEKEVEIYFGKFTQEGLLSGNYRFDHILKNLEDIRDFPYKVDAILIGSKNDPTLLYENIEQVANILSVEEINDLLYRMLNFHFSFNHSFYFRSVKKFITNKEDYCERLMFSPFNTFYDLDSFKELSFSDKLAEKVLSKNGIIDLSLRASLYKEFRDHFIRSFNGGRFLYEENGKPISIEDFSFFEDYPFTWNELEKFILKDKIRNFGSINSFRFLPNYENIVKELFLSVKNTSDNLYFSTGYINNFNLYKHLDGSYEFLKKIVNLPNSDLLNLNAESFLDLPKDIILDFIKKQLTVVPIHKFILSNFDRLSGVSDECKKELDKYVLSGKEDYRIMYDYPDIYFRYEKHSVYLEEFILGGNILNFPFYSLPYNPNIEKKLINLFSISRPRLVYQRKRYINKLDGEPLSKLIIFSGKYKSFEKLILDLFNLNIDSAFNVIYAIGLSGLKSKFCLSILEIFFKKYSPDELGYYFLARIVDINTYLRSFKDDKINKFLDKIFTNFPLNQTLIQGTLSDTNFQRNIIESLERCYNKETLDIGSSNLISIMYLKNGKDKVLNYLRQMTGKNEKNIITFLVDYSSAFSFLSDEDLKPILLNCFKEHFPPTDVIHYGIKFERIFNILRDYNLPHLQKLESVYDLVKNNDILVRVCIFILNNKDISSEELKKQASSIFSLFGLFFDIYKSLPDQSMYLFKDLSLLCVRKLNENHELPYEQRFKDLSLLSTDKIFTLILRGYDESYPSTFRGMLDFLLNKIKESGENVLDVFYKNGISDFRKMFGRSIQHGKLQEIFSMLNFSERDKAISMFIDGLGEDKNENALSSAINIADILILKNIDENLAKNIANKLLVNFKKAKSKEVKALYGLLLRNFENTYPNMNKEVSFFAKDFHIPVLNKVSKERLFVGGINRQRYFFYNDDDGIKSFYSFISRYKNNSKWKITYFKSYIKIESEPPYSKIEIYANIPKEELGDKEIDKLGLSFQVSVHRGHVYHQYRSIEKMQKDQSIVFLGSCGGYNSIVSVFKDSSNASIISTQQTGTTDINDPILYSINEHLLSGQGIDWVNLWPNIEFKISGNRLAKFYIPPHKNNSVLFARAYKDIVGGKGN